MTLDTFCNIEGCVNLVCWMFPQVADMASENMVVAALGRPFTLGMLYDARTDKLIPGKMYSEFITVKHVCYTTAPFTGNQHVFDDPAEQTHFDNLTSGSFATRDFIAFNLRCFFGNM